MTPTTKVKKGDHIQMDASLAGEDFSYSPDQVLKVGKHITERLANALLEPDEDGHARAHIIDKDAAERLLVVQAGVNHESGVDPEAALEPEADEDDEEDDEDESTEPKTEEEDDEDESTEPKTEDDDDEDESTEPKTGESASEPSPVEVLTAETRAELNKIAKRLKIKDADKLPNKEAVAEAIVAARAAAGESA